MRPLALLVCIVFAFFYEPLIAQRTCGYDEVVANLHETDEGFADRHAAWHRKRQQLIRQSHEHGTRETNEIYTIPAVVHVVYRTAAENISDAQILSQIDILNEDFRRMNADAVNTPAAFQGVAADTEIEFCLATFDPDGNPTTGITRTQTTVSSWSGNHNVKYDANGGKDGWPREDYVNIWVCNLGGGLLGYATPPTVADPTRDGIVVGYNYFGNVGTLDPTFNLGRTATHEVGHWLGLDHVWGGGCGVDDDIPDTPTQESPNFGCPAYPSVSCGNGALGGDMFMNYMDYSDDLCFNLFTVDQSTVMRGLFDPGQVRAALLSSTACINPDFHDAEVSMKGLIDTLCGTSLLVPVTLLNAGENDLTMAEIALDYDGVPVDTIEWIGTLTPNQSAQLTFGPISVSSGSHTFRAYSLGMVNGFVDPDFTNDSSSQDTVFILDNQGTPSPYVESFEGGFPPFGGQLLNPDGAITWAWTDTAAWNGNYCVVIEGFTYNTVGAIDEFILPQIDLSTLNNPQLVFYRAYAQFGPNSGFTDRLEILVSVNCGESYQSIWSAAGSTLATVAPISAPFRPTNLGQWRGEVVDLSAFTGETGVYLKFRFINEYENNLYLDAINILDSSNVSVSVATPSTTTFGWQVQPNPSQGKLTLRALRPIHRDVRFSVLDLTGRTVVQRNGTPATSQEMTWDLSNLPKGVYILHATDQQHIWTQRVMLE